MPAPVARARHSSLLAHALRPQQPLGKLPLQQQRLAIRGGPPQGPRRALLAALLVPGTRGGFATEPERLLLAVAESDIMVMALEKLEKLETHFTHKR